MFSQVFPLHLCVLISSYQDTSPIWSGPPQWPQFNCLTYLRRLFPNALTLWYWWLGLQLTDLGWEHKSAHNSWSVPPLCSSNSHIANPTWLFPHSGFGEKGGAGQGFHACLPETHFGRPAPQLLPSHEAECCGYVHDLGMCAGIFATAHNEESTARREMGSSSTWRSMSRSRKVHSGTVLTGPRDAAERAVWGAEDTACRCFPLRPSQLWLPCYPRLPTWTPFSQGASSVVVSQPICPSEAWTPALPSLCLHIDIDWELSYLILMPTRLPLHPVVTGRWAASALSSLCTSLFSPFCCC